MPASEPIRILLVDDHAMVRSGLRTFLMAYDDLILAGEANNGADAILLAGQTRPQVIIMDLIMPSMDGIHATKEIKRRYPEIQVIALTSFTDPGLVQEALAAGAIGYLLKNVSAEELVKAIRAAAQGHSTLAPEAADALVKAAGKPEPGREELSERELEVLRLMIDGKSNAQIAEALVISLSTVKFHVSSILSKLGVKSRTEAIAHATRHNILPHLPHQL